MKIPTRAMNSAALILWFLCVIKADVDVNKWFTGLADPKMECSSLSKMPGCDVVSNDSNEEEPIFAIVKNCKGDGVRWDYNFKTKMKTKGLNDIFEGKGRLEFARFVSASKNFIHFPRVYYKLNFRLMEKHCQNTTTLNSASSITNASS